MKSSHSVDLAQRLLPTMRPRLWGFLGYSFNFISLYLLATFARGLANPLSHTLLYTARPKCQGVGTVFSKVSQVESFDRPRTARYVVMKSLAGDKEVSNGKLTRLARISLRLRLIGLAMTS
jgi:hypothetical protein